MIFKLNIKGKEMIHILYTVIPLERIFADLSNRNNKSDQDQNAQSNIQYRNIILPYGRIVTRQDGDKYVIEKICSTDMSDYLNEDYAPGKTVK
jgi:hypothetical protein